MKKLWPRRLFSLLGLVLLAAFAVGEAHAETREVEFPLTGDIVKARFTFETFETSPKGVLVLAGGAIQPSPEIGGDAEWRKFAQTNHLSLCIVRLIPSEKIKAKAESLPAPVPNAGSLLSRALSQFHFANKPLYLFGFQEGGDFIANSAANRTLRVAAWSCHAATHFPAPARNTPYGIIVANDLDGIMYDHAKDYEEQSRQQGAAMAWISIPGKAQRNPKVEAFVRKCFGTRLDTPSARAVLLDNERKVGVLPPSTPEAAGPTTILLSSLLYQDWRTLHQPSGVITTTVATGLKEFPEIVMALRLPPESNQAQTRILAYCYYFTNAGNVLQMARNDKAGWNQFAAKRGMATITWNVQTLWQNLKSFDQIEDGDVIRQNRIFDAVARAWEAGILKLAKRYHLQDTRILIYGCSRGANFALRLVMRDPRRFSAVVAHVANSFERPTPTALNVVWAITNGEFDPGAPNAKRYYEQCHALGLPLFLRFFPNLGHSESDESLKFARGFFDYVMSQDGKDRNFPQNLAAQSKAPAYVADLTNVLVFPAGNMNAIPTGQRVAIPNKEMAPLWGRLIQ